MIILNKSKNLHEEVIRTQKTLQKCDDQVKMTLFTSEIMRNLLMDLLDLAQMEQNTFKLNKDFFSIFDAIE